MNKIAFLAVIVLTIYCKASGQETKLTTLINRELQGFDGKIGIAITGIDGEAQFTINGNEHFPMQSVFKLPLTIAIMSKVDKRELSLEQIYHLDSNDIHTGTYSPVLDENPNRQADMSLSKLIRYSAGLSDNNTSDFLLKILGGPKELDKYLKVNGFTDIKVQNTENDMQKDNTLQYLNYCSPDEANKILIKLYKRQLLSSESTDTLWKIITGITTGGTKLKALLPAKAIIAHKSGWSGRSNNGITAASNDIGIIVLPSQKAIAISVFITDSKEPTDKIDRFIAKIGKITYDWYSDTR
jgi:beta-lactamase class A